VRAIKINGIFKAHLFITIVLLLTLWGCGSGGGGNGGSGAGESIGSGSIASGGSQPGDSEGSEPDPDPATDNSVTLSWDSPTSNSDGSDLNDLAGYKIYYGTSPNTYTQSINVGNITSAVISSLSPGTWCFATTAYDTAGNESGYSNEACKTV